MPNSSTSSESALADLVSLWQRRRAAGQTVTPGELCRDRPELLPQLEQRIAALQRMDDLADGIHETATIEPAAVPQVADSPQATVSARRPAIPGYEIVGELGRGGMGVVNKARQTQLGRMVALKMILSGGMAGKAELARFRTEAEAIACLQHANIVQIHEVGEREGRPFFSLEFCAGGSLEHKLNGRPLPAVEAARLVETLAQAMEAAHQAHVIHRDLKPANVLLTADGTPKITDFGLAKKLDVQGQTHTGAVMGTPSYMAPEQAGGQKDVGPGADVYALGAPAPMTVFTAFLILHRFYTDSDQIATEVTTTCQ
jgi:serine/threonine-protein kinase